VCSTKPLERLNKEIERRTDLVGVFLNPAADKSALRIHKARSRTVIRHRVTNTYKE
jgi:transposase-like protein